MEKSIQQKNKDLVLKAFDTLFNKRDYATAETFWSPGSTSSSVSAHIEPGREGLRSTLVKSIPATLKYEPGADRCRRRLCNRAWALQRHRSHCVRLDCSGRHTSCRERHSGRALGRHSGRGDWKTNLKSKAPMFGSSFPVYDPEKGMNRHYGDQIQQRNRTRSTQEVIYRSRSDSG